MQQANPTRNLGPVKTLCVASARCRHKHEARSCEQLDASPVPTVVTSINHEAAKQQDALQMLTVATSINLDAVQVLTDAPSIKHGAAKNWMIYKC